MNRKISLRNLRKLVMIDDVIEIPNNLSSVLGVRSSELEFFP
ncbi:hypothetical protein WH8501_20895 [Crocosphaera watsonii WH 8501]|uniref:Uncharacterized protein n=3 Tax=Crocosphaera watsonii TaxID=263511 RepID=T2JM80_CROWT|nr:hypothetical protein [Crocosphaera watsonii]CCQ52960.1 hypothetical protein CWATWH8502_3000 [Crocosphaera watsonii WH 8502]CCQ61029.1 hypothetical protein CWATWH0401_1602 [Crocosphaera watsonii WH 0401]CCQ66159.1 hypothetical protein CWATWH0402_1475 [Crocosphaera watsonii WH 0402]